MPEEYPTPYPRSYWVISCRLLAGAFPGARDNGEAAEKLRSLFDAGIRCIVNLMEPDERDHSGALFFDYAPVFERIAAERGASVRCLRVPVPDLGVPDAATMNSILDAIDAAIAAGMPVYVHCWGGIGRTGTVVGCFLVRHGLAAPERAIERIHDLRYTDAERHRPSPETSIQIRMVETWRPDEGSP